MATRARVFSAQEGMELGFLLHEKTILDEGAIFISLEGSQRGHEAPGSWR